VVKLARRPAARVLPGNRATPDGDAGATLAGAAHAPAGARPGFLPAPAATTLPRPPRGKIAPSQQTGFVKEIS